jgi:YebC/PmpR family DNA-binding regulatory protein
MGAQWKHKGKNENAAAKGRIFSKLVKEIMMAAKAGADPDGNPRLRLAIDAAKKASMTRDTLERAIKKGSGQLDDPVNFELVTYEGFAPHQVPVIVECLTENRTRTAANIRTLFKKGQLAAGGAVTWDFTHVGVIEAAPPAGVDPESAAIEAGAQDLEPAEEGATRFFTEGHDLDTVQKALAAAGWKVQSMHLAWRAKNPKTVSEAERHDVEKFLGELDEDDDVQNIYVALA